MSVFNLLYLSIGSGHRMAARALGEAIRAHAPGAEVDILDPLARTAPIFPFLANLGLSLNTRFGGAVYDARWRKGDARIVGWAARQPWIVRDRIAGDGVAATHVFALRLALAQRARIRAANKIFGVVTDFGLHGYWPLEGVDGYFVGSDELRGEFIQRGFPAEKVIASGIPLRLDFASTDAWQPRRAGGPLRVLILAGGVSSGAYAIDLAWFRELLACLTIPPQDARLTIVAGSRNKLRIDLEKLARETRFEVYPRGLVGDMAGAMRSHDLLVAKPGGLTVAEALACGLPLAALRPGAGQETANCEFLRRNEVWIEAFTPCQAAGAISRAAQEPGWLAELGRRCKGLGRPRAALDVAQTLLKECS